MDIRIERRSATLLRTARLHCRWTATDGDNEEGAPDVRYHSSHGDMRALDLASATGLCCFAPGLPCVAGRDMVEFSSRQKVEQGEELA